MKKIFIILFLHFILILNLKVICSNVLNNDQVSLYNNQFYSAYNLYDNPWIMLDDKLNNFPYKEKYSLSNFSLAFLPSFLSFLPAHYFSKYFLSNTLEKYYNYLSKDNKKRINNMSLLLSLTLSFIIYLKIYDKISNNIDRKNLILILKEWDNIRKIFNNKYFIEKMDNIYNLYIHNNKRFEEELNIIIYNLRIIINEKLQQDKEFFNCNIPFKNCLKYFKSFIKLIL